MWASFTKTRAARKRGGHASLIRHVALTCVDEADGEVQIDAKDHSYYDVDWNSGTVWAGVHKLGSGSIVHLVGNMSAPWLVDGWMRTRSPRQRG